MPRRIDPSEMLGRTFGRLTVLSQAPHQPRRPTRWVCGCRCGSAPRSYDRAALTRGHAKSCGCLRSERMQERWASFRTAREADPSAPCAKGLTVGTVRSRLERGWPLERALTEPPIAMEARWGSLRGQSAGTAEV